MRLIRTMKSVGRDGFALLCLCAFFLVGCANQYPTHIAYTDTSEEGALVTGIQTYQFNLTTGPRYMQAGAVAKNGEVGEKVGESTRHSTLFGLVEWGNNGVGEAANQGGIKEVRTVQNGGIDVLWGIVYSEQTTLVTGASEYANHLPLKIPKEGKVLQEGLYLETNGNLAVKNSQNLTLDLIKNGEISRKIKLDQQEFAVSYGFENTGERTILITPVEMKNSKKFLINDKIVTFVPKSSLVIVLGNKMSVKEYKSVPEGLLRVEPVVWWEEQLTTNEHKSGQVIP